MKRSLPFIFSLLATICTSNLTAQNWSATGAIVPINAQYLVAAAHVGSNILAIGNGQNLARSTDNGTTWTAPSITPPPGVYAALFGAKDRFYANMKINTYDYELHYTLDNGTTWTRDTVGLPKNIPATGKASLYVVYLGDDYVMAYNSGAARFKKLGDVQWQTTTIDFIIIDVIAMDGDWYAIGASKILKSTDKGTSWNAMTTSGLPNPFQGNKLASNGLNRLFVSEAPASGGDDIYFSDDGGANWSLTNSSGNYTHANAWVGAMYAVDDYLFAAVSPEFANFQSPPPYLESSTTQPNFAPGDTTGLGNGLTTSALPFFFHIGPKLFTMMGDLYTTTPGFTGNMGVNEEEFGFEIFPNPAHNYFTIKAQVPIEWQLLNTTGQLLNAGKGDIETTVSIAKYPEGIYLLNIIRGEESKVYKVVKQ